MLKKGSKGPKPYRIVIVFSLLFLLLVEIYIIMISFHTVNVSSFDVEAVANKVKIDESRKTFSINNYNGDFIKASKEYKAVLASFLNNIAVIDTDNELKIINQDENILVIFNDFSLDPKYITSTTLFEEKNIVKINFIGTKNGKDFNIDYCYNKDTKEIYVIKNS